MRDLDQNNYFNTNIVIQYAEKMSAEFAYLLFTFWNSCSVTCSWLALLSRALVTSDWWHSEDLFFCSILRGDSLASASPC